MKNILYMWVYRPYNVVGITLANFFLICVPIMVYFLILASSRESGWLEELSQLPEWMMISAFLYSEYIRDIRTHYSHFPHRREEELGALMIGVVGLIGSSILLAMSIEAFYLKGREVSSTFFTLQWVVLGLAGLCALVAKLFVVWRSETNTLRSEASAT